MKDLTILMDATLGAPAEILEDVRARGVEVEASCLFPRLGGRVAHMAVADGDVDAVRQVAGENGWAVAEEKDCVKVPPGYNGGYEVAAARLARAGIALHVFYHGAQGEMILVTSDPDETLGALGL